MMNLFTELTDRLVEQLKEMGIAALRAWERDRLPRLEGAAAVLGIRQSRSSDAALWHYLGNSVDEATGGTVERYGKQVALELYADLYAPMGQAEAIDDLFCQMETLCFTRQGGLRFSQLQRGETAADSASGYLKCRCTLLCTAYILASRREEDAMLTDFILKGVVQ